MIYDTFIFLNELDLLEVRLKELYSVVDKFVLVEGTRNFRGQPKPLHFEENKQRFAEWLPKIEHVVVDDLPDGDDPWKREFFSREATKRGCTPNDNDIIVVSDLDEIPRAVTVARFQPEWGMVGVAMPTYWYYFNYRQVLYPDLMDRPKIISGKVFNSNTLEYIRFFDAQNRGLVMFGGWHFSFMGGVQQISYKVRSFAHCFEPSAEPMLERFSRIPPEISEGDRLARVRIDKFFPECIFNNQDEWQRRGFIKQ